MLYAAGTSAKSPTHVDSAEVVPSELHAQRGPVVLPFFAESVRQPGQPADLHPHGKVLAFNVASANPSTRSRSATGALSMMVVMLSKGSS